MLSRILLYIGLVLLMVVSILELTFVSLTVTFLHGPASNTFSFNWNGSTYELGGLPKYLHVDQGHVSNAAAGAAFIVVCCGGTVALFLRSRLKPHRIGIIIYRLWLVLNVLALLLTLGALIYVLVVASNQHQRINPTVAARLDGAPYNLEEWTPKKWFLAVLKLDLASSHDRNIISKNLRFICASRCNLIVFFIVQFFETCVALWDAYCWSARCKDEEKNNTLDPAVSYNRRSVVV